MSPEATALRPVLNRPDVGAGNKISRSARHASTRGGFLFMLSAQLGCASAFIQKRSQNENSRKQNAERHRLNRVLFTRCDGTTVGVGSHLAFAYTPPAALAAAAG